jgi:hypothetical protein
MPTASFSDALERSCRALKVGGPEGWTRDPSVERYFLCKLMPYTIRTYKVPANPHGC